MYNSLNANIKYKLQRENFFDIFIKHIERNGNKLSNKQIDKTKSNSNVHIKKMDLKELNLRLNKWKKEPRNLKGTHWFQKNCRLTTSIVKTLKVNGDYDIKLSNQVLKKYLINLQNTLFSGHELLQATIHNDEVNPHIHITFLNYNEKKQKWVGGGFDKYIFRNQFKENESYFNEQMKRKYNIEIDNFLFGLKSKLKNVNQLKGINTNENVNREINYFYNIYQKLMKGNKNQMFFKHKPNSVDHFVFLKQQIKNYKNSKILHCDYVSSLNFLEKEIEKHTKLQNFEYEIPKPKLKVNGEIKKQKSTKMKHKDYIKM